MRTKTESMDRRKAPWRALNKLRFKLNIQRDLAKSAAERAGDHKDHLWWLGVADGLHQAEELLGHLIYPSKR